MTDNKTLNETLRRLLATNIVCFTYKKVNGEIRKAKGTRNLQLARAHTGMSIPDPTGYEQPTSYYDVESLGWRSYRDGNLISIDGVVARTDTDFAKKPTTPNVETKRGELPKREIPVSRPMGNGAADIDKILGGIFGGFGMPPMGEIRKAMDDLDKDIVIGAPAHSPKIGTPTATEKGIELPLGSVSVDDFAKLVAHYAVEEFVSRLTR